MTSASKSLVCLWFAFVLTGGILFAISSQHMGYGTWGPAEVATWKSHFGSLEKDFSADPPNYDKVRERALEQYDYWVAGKKPVLEHSGNYSYGSYCPDLSKMFKFLILSHLHSEDPTDRQRALNFFEEVVSLRSKKGKSEGLAGIKVALPIDVFEALQRGETDMFAGESAEVPIPPAEEVAAALIEATVEKPAAGSDADRCDDDDADADTDDDADTDAEIAKQPEPEPITDDEIEEPAVSDTAISSSVSRREVLTAIAMDDPTMIEIAQDYVDAVRNVDSANYVDAQLILAEAFMATFRTTLDNELALKATEIALNLYRSKKVPSHEHMRTLQEALQKEILAIASGDAPPIEGIEQETASTANAVCGKCSAADTSAAANTDATDAVSEIPTEKASSADPGTAKPADTAPETSTAKPDASGFSYRNPDCKIPLGGHLGKGPWPCGCRK